MRLSVKPTRAGARDGGDAAGRERSRRRPSGGARCRCVTAVNRIDAVKPGATVLLTGTDESRAERPMLIFQRYGRGKTFAFLPQDSWMWQMHATIPVEDLTHENYWRQLLRWLVDGVPDQVEPALTTERVEPGEAATLSANIVDPSFVELNDAAVMATITAPDGTISDVPMSWDGEHAGQYQATIPTKAPGWYEAKIDATRAGKSVGSAVTHFRAAPGDAEYFDATMHAGTLRRIADETGGRFYDPSNTVDARRRSALHRPRRDDGRGTRAVAHADRVDAAGRPAVRGMGVSTCRRPGVTSHRRAGAVIARVSPKLSRAQDDCRPSRRRRIPAILDRPNTTDASRSRASATAPPSIWRAAASAASRPGRTTSRAPIFIFLKILGELTFVPTFVDQGNILTLDDPDLAMFPIAYMSEPGFWTMSEAETAGLRELPAQGRLHHLRRLPRQPHPEPVRSQMRQVYPEARVPEARRHASDLSLVFRNQRARSSLRLLRDEGDTEWLGIFEDNDPRKRLIAIANNNHDLGELWEFSDTGYVPVDLSNEAYKFGVNYVMYAMTH